MPAARPGGSGRSRMVCEGATKSKQGEAGRTLGAHLLCGVRNRANGSCANAPPCGGPVGWCLAPRAFPGECAVRATGLDEAPPSPSSFWPASRLALAVHQKNPDSVDKTQGLRVTPTSPGGGPATWDFRRSLTRVFLFPRGFIFNFNSSCAYAV